ncbi:MAG: hypothetical protein M1820_009081 [Bogoriella megaspora]|nr:MAG: hypothetical protein M1820_009081 [Bogoriella megaspora]
MHLILTGATGLVGAAALQAMLTRESVTKISIISRRPVAMAEGHEKVKVHIQKDFSTIDSTILEELKGAHGCVWAMGISMNQVTKEEYTKITQEYPTTFAEAFSRLSPTFNFVYVSGEGVSTKPPGLFTPSYSTIKGRTETSLLSLSKEHPSLKVFNLRPGAVDAKDQPEIHPFLPKYTSLQKKGEKLLIPAIRAVMPGLMSPTKELGEFMVDLAAGDGSPLEGEGTEEGGRTIGNKAFRRKMGFTSGT